MSKNRIEKFQLCLTKQEKLQATQLAKNLGTTVSAFFRSAIYKKHEISQIRSLPEINVKTYLKLGKLSNNINQIAKVLNSYQKLNTTIPYDVLFELKQEVDEIKKQLTTLLNQFKLILQEFKK